MYVQGVSTRKVAAVLEELCGTPVSSTHVSHCAARLDAEVESWRSRPLAAFPYVTLDARYEKVRHGGRVIDCAVLIALGIGPDGQRQILGASVALSEAEVHWRDFLTSLLKRGLCGLQILVSDNHAGLAAARRAVFPSLPWQRCQFHLPQNARASVLRLDLRAKVAADIRSVFPAPDRAHAQARLQEIVAAYAPIAPKLSTWTEENLPRGLMAAPAATLRAVFRTAYLAPLDSPSSNCRPPTSAACAPPTPSNGSTRNSNAAPASPPSSPTKPPFSAAPRPPSTKSPTTGCPQKSTST